jgi:hypothetical protein
MEARMLMLAPNSLFCPPAAGLSRTVAGYRARLYYITPGASQRTKGRRSPFALRRHVAVEFRYLEKAIKILIASGSRTPTRAKQTV